MSFEYIANTYGVPAKKGARVAYKGRPATVVRATGAYIWLHFDDEEKPDKKNYHPTYEMDWNPGEGK